jgi:hypothetical protein
MRTKKGKDFTLLSREALDKFRRDRFSGEVIVRLENGVINDLNLTDRCFEFQID